MLILGTIHIDVTLMRYRHLLKQFLCAFSLILLNCFHAEAIPITGVHNLSATLGVLEDPQNLLHLHDVQTNRTFSQLQSDDVFNVGYSASTWWLRVTLPADDTPTQRILEIPYANLSHITLYLPGQPPIYSGEEIPHEQRAWPHRDFAFPVYTQDTETIIYLKVRSAGPITVPVLLWEQRAFTNSTLFDYIKQSIYYGGGITLSLYNLLIFFSLREHLFLRYAIFACCIVIAIMSGNGIAGQYVWPAEWSANPHLQPLLYSLALLTGIDFSRHFLDLPCLMPKSNKALIALLSIITINIVLALCATSAQLEWKLMSSVSIVSVCIIFGLAVRAVYLGNRNARFFLLAWATFLAGILIASLRNFGLVDTNFITANAVQLSSALEMLLLSFALADRIRHERSAREMAQRDILRIRQTLVESLQASELQLERAVTQRTEELHRSLENEQAVLERYIRFGAFISHEFRNPLAIIRAQVALLSKETARGINNLEQRISALLNATARLSRLFDDWLGSDRLRQATQALSLSPIAVAPWLQRCAAEYRERYTHHRVRVHLPAERLPTLSVDEPMLRIALGNLVDNAAKYSPLGTNIDIRAEANETQLTLSVCDQGPGIAPEFQAQVFNDYFRVSPDSGTPGLGLGLALVKRVVDLHGGHIHLHSTPGLGCCFVVSLPIGLHGVAPGVSVHD